MNEDDKDFRISEKEPASGSAGERSFRTSGAKGTDDVEDEAPFAHGSAAEAELARRLEEGPLEEEDPEAEAVTRLSPRWEMRVQTERDPVAEETKLYRKLAKEVDGRYGEE